MSVFESMKNRKKVLVKNWTYSLKMLFLYHDSSKHFKLIKRKVSRYDLLPFFGLLVENSEGGDGWWWKAGGCPRVMLSMGHFLCWVWLQAGCNHTLQVCLEQVSPNVTPAASDLSSGVFNMREKCDAACSSYRGHEGGYTAQSPV